MLYRSYNKETKLAVASIISIFNNITISRFNKDGSVKKDIRIPVKYAHESQIIKSLRDKNKVQSLPVITVSRTSLQRDVERVVDLHRPFLFQGPLYSETQINDKTISEETRIYRKYSYDFRRNNPQPMNIGFKVTIFAQYEEDLQQILGNFIPFISPFVVVASYHPYDKSQIIRSKIFCDGTISEELPEEQNIAEMEIWKASIDLTYAGWYWFGMEKDKYSAFGGFNTIKDIVIGGQGGPVGNINKGDVPEPNQYVDEETGDIFNGIDTGKNINDGDKVEPGEWVDEETGIIYRKDYHFAEGTLMDGFFITAPGQTIKELDDMILQADTHDELPYHEHLSIS